MRKVIVRGLSSLLPGVFTRIAYNQLTHPQVKKLRPHEEEVMATAEQAEVKIGETAIRTYRWGGGDKSIMLMHGWEGQAGNFSDFIEPLRRAGFSIFTFDAPSHGASPQGGTTLVEFIAVGRQLLRDEAPSHLMSHSFGAVPMTYALSSSPGLSLGKYVMLTTPNRFVDRIGEIAEEVGIAQGVVRRLTRIMEREFAGIEGKAVDAETLNVEDFVQRAKVDRVLILHDAADKVIPLVKSQRVAECWPQATLEVVKGTGHFRILRTPSVIERAVSFLTT